MNYPAVGEILAVFYVDDSLKPGSEKYEASGVGVRRAALVTGVTEPDDEGHCTVTGRVFLDNGDDEIAELYEAPHVEDDPDRPAVQAAYVYMPR